MTAHSRPEIVYSPIAPRGTMYRIDGFGRGTAALVFRDAGEHFLFALDPANWPTLDGRPGPTPEPTGDHPEV